jgi:hypothetical protein
MFNKIGCGVGIIWMEEVSIPCEYGMEVTSHCDQISDGKLVFYSLFTCFCFDQFIFVSYDFPFWFSCVCTFLTFGVAFSNKCWLHFFMLFAPVTSLWMSSIRVVGL